MIASLLLGVALLALFAATGPDRASLIAAGAAAALFALSPLAGLGAAGLWFGSGLVSAKIAQGREKAAVREALADLVLSLSLAASDGQGVSLSLERIPHDALPPALQQSVLALKRDLRTHWDAQAALSQFAQRLGLEEGQRLVAALLRERALGMSLKDTLVRQADTLRFERLQRSRRRLQYLPYLLTVVAGLLFINLTLLLGYPQLLALMSHLGQGL